MMMKKTVLLAALSLLGFLAGCGRTPGREPMPAAEPPRLADSAVVEKRTREFRDALRNVKIRGVGIFPKAFHSRYSNSQVLDCVSKLGFNRIYCYITSEQEIDDNLRSLIQEAAARELPVEIVVMQRDYYRRYHSNQIIRPLLWQYPSLPDVVRDVVRFNEKLLDNAKLAGVTIVVSPHLFNTKNVERVHRHLFRWSDTTYGKGLDNDMLMRWTFELLSQIAAEPGLPPLTIGFSDFYHERAVAGDLSVGAVKDFSMLARRVLVIDSGNKPTQLVAAVTDELKDAPAGVSVLVAVQLADHTSEEQGRLRRRDWNDLVRALNYSVPKFNQYPAFGGVVLSPLAVVEFLRREQ